VTTLIAIAVDLLMMALDMHQTDGVLAANRSLVRVATGRAAHEPDDNSKYHVFHQRMRRPVKRAELA
jgi:hypothetical protein